MLAIADAEELDLSSFEKLWVVGAGKAVVPLAAVALEMFGDSVAGTSITTGHGHARGAAFDVWEAGHPTPDAGSLAGAADALRLARSAGSSDLVICLLTGGASSLWAAPVRGVPLADLREVTTRLLRSGATIQQVNAVRKHLSLIGGGRLAAAALPAAVLTFALSDVIGSQAEAIGSGPTVPDPTTYEDALSVVSAAGVDAPSSVIAHLQRGAAGEADETPKQDELPPGRYHLLADISTAIAGAEAELRARGYEPIILTTAGEGDACTIARWLATEALARRSHGATRQALVWGGESTVRVTGPGKGGRNQEMVLAAAMELEGSEGVTMACFATDGSDGPTSAAGGFADGGSVQRGRALGMDAEDFLRRSDSNSYLGGLKDLIVTGPTGTNVNDIAVALIS